MLLLNKKIVNFLIIFFIILISFQKSFAQKILLTDNKTIEINILDEVNNKLKNFVFSSIPFEVNLEVNLKKYSGILFIKDKTIKTYKINFKFNYEIIKKVFVISYENKIIRIKNYKDFLRKISIFTLKNFLPEKKDGLYLKINISFSPIKGSFSFSDIYILNKATPINYTKKIDLEELIGTGRN